MTQRAWRGGDQKYVVFIRPGGFDTRDVPRENVAIFDSPDQGAAYNLRSALRERGYDADWEFVPYIPLDANITALAQEYHERNGGGENEHRRIRFREITPDEADDGGDVADEDEDVPGDEPGPARTQEMIDRLGPGHWIWDEGAEDYMWVVDRPRQERERRRDPNEPEFGECHRCQATTMRRDGEHFECLNCHVEAGGALPTEQPIPTVQPRVQIENITAAGVAIEHYAGNAVEEFHRRQQEERNQARTRRMHEPREGREPWQMIVSSIVNGEARAHSVEGVSWSRTMPYGWVWMEGAPARQWHIVGEHWVPLELAWPDEDEMSSQGIPLNYRAEGDGPRGPRYWYWTERAEPRRNFRWVREEDRWMTQAEFDGWRNANRLAE